MGDSNFNIIKLSSPETKQYWEIPILFEDANLLVVEKPAGLLSLRGQHDNQLADMLSLFRRDINKGAKWVLGRNLDYLNCVYALDANTTGVLVFSKNEETQNFLTSYAGSEKPFRSFHVLVHGHPAEESFRVNAGILPHPIVTGKMKIDLKRGKRSVTNFRILEGFNKHSFLECVPITNRVHQIRVHLHYIKCPAVADTLYYGRPLLLSSMKKSYRQGKHAEERPLIARSAIHCSKVVLPQQNECSEVVIESPLAKDISVSLKMLRRYAPKFDFHTR